MDFHSFVVRFATDKNEIQVSSAHTWWSQTDDTVLLHVPAYGDSAVPRRWHTCGGNTGKVGVRAGTATWCGPLRRWAESHGLTGAFLQVFAPILSDLDNAEA